MKGKTKNRVETNLESNLGGSEGHPLTGMLIYCVVVVDSRVFS